MPQAVVPSNRDTPNETWTRTYVRTFLAIHPDIHGMTKTADHHTTRAERPKRGW